MSLKAIAQELGISITTVSRGLNGYSDVAEHTRQLIMAAAEARGYLPNASARRLKTGRTDAVGLVYPMVTAALYDPNLLDIVANITSAFADFNIDIVMVSDQEHHGHSPYVSLIESGRVDALIVMDVMNEDPRINYLQSRGHKFLSFGRCNTSKPYAWIDFDCEIGSRRAVRYLLDKGHRQIAYLGGNDERAFISQRKDGFIQEMNAAGIAVPEHYILQCARNRRSGLTAMKQILTYPDRPTAILVDSSMLADGAIMVAEQAGLIPGEDISFIAYDGLPPDTLSDKQMTSVQLSTSEKKSKQIADMTIALIRGEKPENLHVLWEPEIVEGNTVKDQRTTS